MSARPHNREPKDPPDQDTPWVASGQSLDWLLRAMGVALVLTAATPIQVEGRDLVFVHEALAEASPAEAVGALAPMVAGLVFVLLTLLPSIQRLGLALGAGITAAVALALAGLNPDAYEQIFVVGATAFRRHPYPVLVALTLFGAAGATAPFRPLRPVTRALIVGGWACVLAFLSLPQRGVPMIWHIVGGLLEGANRGGSLYLVAVLLGATVALIPAFIGLAALPLWKGHPRWGTFVQRLSAFTLPVLAVVMGYQLLLQGAGAASLLLTVRSAILLCASTLPLIACTGALGLHLVEAPTAGMKGGRTLARDALLLEVAGELTDSDPVVLEHSASFRGLHPLARFLVRWRYRQLATELGAAPERPATLTRVLSVLGRSESAEAPVARTLAVRWLGRPFPELTAVLVLAAIAAATFLSLRAPPKGVPEWNLTAPNAEADKLFGEVLPRYVVARVERDAGLASAGGSAQAAYRLREQTKALDRGARSISPDLADALASFADSVESLDVSGRAWRSGIGRINAEIRRLGLPYYVDADVWEVETDGRRRRYLYVKTYKVARVRRFAANGRLFAAIHVWRLDHLNIRSALLGFSRDEQPFAMVLLDEVEAYLSSELPLLYATEPICRAIDPDAAPWRHELNRECGRRLRGAVEDGARAWTEAERAELGLLTAALAKRTDPWLDLSRRLTAREHAPPTPETLVLNDNTMGHLRRYAEGDEELALLEQIESANREVERAGTAAFERLRTLFAVTTERHEVQHQIDGPGLTTPRKVYRMLPGYSDDAVARAARELSGYLAELDLDDVSADFGLAHLLTFLSTPSFSNRPEYFAAALVFELLSGTAVVDHDGAVVPSALHAAYVAVSDMERPARVERLSEAYQALFEVELPILREVER